jgi:hypothetical protein
MNWVLCKQTLHDSICYSSSDNEDLQYLSYYKFLEYIHNFLIQDFVEFKNQLDKFEVLLIDIDNHSWEIYKEKEEKEATFEELLSLNEIKTQEKTKIEKIKEKIFKYSQVKTYAGESYQRNINGDSAWGNNRQIRRGGGLSNSNRGESDRPLPWKK